MARDFNNHPCFNARARHKHGRIHLPVAPKCNISCGFCNRKYDCVAESRPGVTSAVLSPGQAMAYLNGVMEHSGQISVVGIAGPGDPFANAEATMETLGRVRAAYPDMLLCLATNGLEIHPHIDELAELDVSHVTITMNAVDPEVAAKIYAWVRDGKRVLRGIEAATCLLERQQEAIAQLKARHIVVKVNCILIPGINLDDAIHVAKRARDLGADILNCIPLYPVEGSNLEDVPPPSIPDIIHVRVQSARYIAQMHHCTRCRADAVGLLDEGTPDEYAEMLQKYSSMPLNPQDDKLCIAVGSHEGMLVNQHLGEADSLWIYRHDGERFVHVETRETPPAGQGRARWHALAESLKDCRAILVSGAGPSPQEALGKHGIQVVVTEGLIETLLDDMLQQRPLPAPRSAHACGVGCAGTGTGCG